MNSKGHPASLVPAQPGNTNAVRHGAYSPRALAPRADEIAAALMTAPHAVPLDQIAAEEIGSLVAMLETIDADLQGRGLTNEEGDVRTLAELRIRVSGRLERWLREFGATPASRVDWVGKLSTSDDLVAKLRQAMAEPPLEHAGDVRRHEQVVDPVRGERADDRAAGDDDDDDVRQDRDREDADRGHGRAVDGPADDDDAGRDGLEDDRGDLR